ncbi:GP2b protein [Zambian malbrouck virus 1]|uniref:GP2b protein n=1 Tax=Zambian malbrouck virus 1 TaxID=2682610 RepID=A0A167L796_9NIDO|nr:GP2b protein [Zambian malbrouck virus 1]ANB32507.1 GP2b protein [Zambian malbrouck virus 1]
MPSTSCLSPSLTSSFTWLLLFLLSLLAASSASPYAAFSNVSQELAPLTAKAACARISHLCQPNILPSHSFGITAKSLFLDWFSRHHSRMLGTAQLQVKGIRAVFTYNERCVRLPSTLLKEAALKESIGVKAYASLVCHQFLRIACDAYQNKTTLWDTTQSLEYSHSLHFCVVCSAIVLSSLILTLIFQCF